MGFPHIISILAFIPTLASAALITVGPGEIYTEIQMAINASSPGDVIEVAPGMYPENLVIHKSPLTLRGAQAGQDARGRVTGAPDPLTESVVQPPAGAALTLASADGAISVNGFSFLANTNSGSGVVISDTTMTPEFSFSENHLVVLDGATGPALALGSDAIDATVSKNVMVGAETSLQVVLLDGGALFHGFELSGNDILRAGAALHQGVSIDGNRNFGPSGTRTPAISENRFVGHQIGFFGGARSLDQCEVSANIFENNVGGMAAGPRGSEFTNNDFRNNQKFGLRLSGFGETADASHGAQGTTVEGCRFEGNGATVDPAGHGDLVLDDQAPGTHASNVYRENQFLSTDAVFNLEPVGDIEAAYNYWNSADGPGGLEAGSGCRISGFAINFEPFYTDAELTQLFFGTTALNGPLVLDAGVTIEGASFVIGSLGRLTVNQGALVEVDFLELEAGAELLIRNGAVKTGSLVMEDDAILDVIDGSLSLDPQAIGLYHTIDGTFTFFNSLGSLNINGNTIFSGSSLCLVSNIHFAAGTTALVIGNLAFDGCRIDGTGNYNILVNAGGVFEMTRCEISEAFINLVASDVKLCDNHFTSGLITVFSTVNGAEIYHNIFDMGTAALNVLPGAVIDDSSEGWGNVDDKSLVQNRLALDFREPLDPTRTLTAEGNLFVQPGDPVPVGIDISQINTTTQAVEAVLGFSSDYLVYDALAPSPDWSSGLYDQADSSEIVGRFNTAVGLSFDPLTPNGTTSDGEVADIGMTALSLEGETRFFFREKTIDDGPLTGTRLTVSSAGVPSYLNAPFTENSGVLTVDGTIPEFGADFSVSQVQSGSSVDLLPNMIYTKEGIVSVVFDSRDLLAGIDDVDVSVSFSGPVGSFSGSLISKSEITISGEGFSQFTFEGVVGPATPNGIYNVDATVMDRSGNIATLPMGAIEVARFSSHVVVATQGLTNNALTRNVVFVATDSSGAVLAMWDEPVSFLNGEGEVTLIEIPVGAVALSAKTAWNLRVRLPLVFDAFGVASVSYTGVDELPGGDFNGDNFVTGPDFNILRLSFPGTAPGPDITGDGVVNTPDFNIFRFNWLTSGDPL